MSGTPISVVGRSALQPAAIRIGIAGAASLTLGVLVAHAGEGIVVFAVVAPIFLWLALRRPGFLVGGLWLIALNGIPLVNIETGVGQLRPTDIVVLLLAVTAVLTLLVSREPRPRFPMPLAVASSLFGIWWLITVARSVDTGIPVTDAFLFGRDFLSLIVVIPAGWILLTRPGAWRDCALVVALGTGLYASVYIAGTLGLVNAATFTHPEQVRNLVGVQRLYTPMNDLVMIVAVFGACALATSRSRVSLGVVTLTGITLTAFLLQLTRAAYLGMAAAALVAVVAALSRGAQTRRRTLRRVAALAGVLSVGSLAFVGVASTTVGSTAVGQRISTAVTEAGEGSGTVGYRVRLYHQMLGVLGADWPVGLGFLHPRDRFFPDLPDGTIRNADVGLTNILMTMGAVGLLLEVGILAAVGHLVSRARRAAPPWIVVGTFAWLALLVTTSPTLITLFSPTGLLCTGLTLALCAVGLKSIQADTGPDT
jgi:hypothetical protein